MEIRSILVYVSSDADNALGENVLKLPLLLALSEAFPTAGITWVPGTSGAFHLRNVLAPLVGGRIAEFIDDLVVPTDPRQSLALARHRGHPILDRHFDLIIDTQRCLGRTLFLRRVPHHRFISGTWRYFWSDTAPPKPLPRRPPRLVDKLVGLASAAAGEPTKVANPIPLPPEWRARAGRLLPAGPLYVGLAPGAGNKQRGKCWPLDGYIALARRQIEHDRVPVFVLGPEERDWADPLHREVPQALFPPTAAQGPCLAAALGERLAAAVANCSGTGHLLAAGGAPMVSLYGPTRPEKFAPFARALVCLRAQDYGSGRIAAIPLDAVAAAVDRQVRIGPAVTTMPASRPAAASRELVEKEP
jgi:ADP-heptose:LPS heptosyltransferase